MFKFILLIFFSLASQASESPRPIQFGMLYNASIKSAHKISSAHDSPLGLEHFFGVQKKLSERFSLTFVGNISHWDVSGTIMRDTDIRDANGTSVRLVSKEEDLFGVSTGADVQLNYHINFLSFNLLPFVGLGLGLGFEEGEQQWKTDRAVPILFSNHNRYTIKNERSFTSACVIYGASLFFKRFQLIFKGRITSYSNSDDIDRTTTTNGESFAFTQEQLNFMYFPSHTVEHLFGLGLNF